MCSTHVWTNNHQNKDVVEKNMVPGHSEVLYGCFAQTKTTKSGSAQVYCGILMQKTKSTRWLIASLPRRWVDPKLPWTCPVCEGQGCESRGAGAVYTLPNCKWTRPPVLTWLPSTNTCTWCFPEMKRKGHRRHPSGSEQRPWGWLWKIRSRTGLATPPQSRSASRSWDWVPPGSMKTFVSFR